MLIERGQYEFASHKLNYMREQITENPDDFNAEILRKLLSLRISMNNGFPSDSCLQFDIDRIQPAAIKGEIYAVQGLYYYFIKNYIKSKESFIKAERFYQECQWIEKEYIAKYNIISCQINIHSKNMTEDDFEELIKLQKNAELKMLPRVLGLVHRQKSYFFKDHAKFRAAIHEAQMSLKYLEAHSTKADFHFGLLNLCDCYIENNEIEKALTTYERIIGALDKRVTFAYEFIKFKLGLSKKKPLLDDSADPHFSLRWKYYVENKLSRNDFEIQENQTESSMIMKYNNDIPSLYFWDSQNKRLLNSLKSQDDLSSQIKSKSKEFIIIESLIDNPQSSKLLGEKLWPDYVDLTSLNLRLYQRISRLNKKFPNLIISKDGKYYIQCQKVD